MCVIYKQRTMPFSIFKVTFPLYFSLYCLIRKWLQCHLTALCQMVAEETWSLFDCPIWLKKLRRSHPAAIRVIFLHCWAQEWTPTAGQEIISPPETRLMFICGPTSSSRCSLDVLTWFLSCKDVWFGLQLTRVCVAGRTGRLGRGEQTPAAPWL